MSNIYEMTSEFKTLWALMEEGTLDDDMLTGAFETATEDLAAKMEGYCKFIKNLESDIEGLKAEEQRLHAKRQTMENTVRRAKAAMQDALTAAGEKKLEAGTWTVALQQNPPRVIIDAQYIEIIPARYIIPQEPEVNKKLMMEDLKADPACKDLEGIAHLERSESLRIK